MTTIAAIASGDARFNILVATLAYVDARLPGTNLLHTVSDPHANLTVFAPTDTAFGSLAKNAGFDGDVTDESAVFVFLTSLGAETLRDVILYHVSPGAKTLAEIGNAGVVNTALGATITPDGTTLIDNDPDLDDPTVVIPDIAASNGIIHAIDEVLLPIDLPSPEPELPTIAATALADDRFTILVAALGFVDASLPGTNLVGTLSTPGADLTVFAPTDLAFGNLAGFDGDITDELAVINFLTGLGAETLRDVILYHVSPGAKTLAEIGAAGVVNTALTPDGATLIDNDPDLAPHRVIRTASSTRSAPRPARAPAHDRRDRLWR